MKNKMKKSNARLRNTIEQKIGRKILEKIKQTRDESSGPIMIPPIPDSKFIDKLPEGELEGQNIQEKEHQDSYEAEVRLYRSLEQMERNFLVIHQLEFTHEQYSAFVGQHLCNRKRCKKGDAEHPCHKESKQIEGECDMVVVGVDFAIIFEVKALNLQHNKEDELKLKGCCESAILQRKRMKELIRSIDVFKMTFEFTIYPNISVEEVPKSFLKDETILFGDDLDIIKSVVHCCQELALLTSNRLIEEKLVCCLLGLWCIDRDGNWDMNKSSLNWCIKDIDQKLRDALVTRKLVDREYLRKSSQRGKMKAMKKYPENPEMVEAPKIFQYYLNIRCLTQDQLDVFNSEERFLWVEGPAGAGKTVAMLGKIIDLVLSKPPKIRILIISIGEVLSPAFLRNFKLLDSITTVGIVRYVFFDRKHVPNFDLVSTLKSLAEELQKNTHQIVLLTMLDTLTRNLYDIITSNFDYVFVDDYHLLTDLLLNKSDITDDELNWYKENIVSQGLLPLVENCDKNRTSLWVFYDIVQASYDNISPHKPFYPSYKALAETLTHFKNLFPNRFKLTVNLRNTVEMSSVLSVIRGQRKVIESSTGVESIDLPEQKLGHVLRGTKPVIHILREDNFDAAMAILEKDLKKLKTSECSLDVAVMPYSGGMSREAIIKFCQHLSREYRVRVISQLDCMSAEWPAVICLYRFECSAKGPLPDHIRKNLGTSGFTSNLYVSLSRARVYFKMILYNYTPNIFEDTDQILSALKQRRDICQVIEEL